MTEGTGLARAGRKYDTVLRVGDTGSSKPVPARTSFPGAGRHDDGAGVDPASARLERDAAVARIERADLRVLQDAHPPPPPLR